MTTTTGTTSTSTASQASVTTSATQSLLTSLNTGSGVDTTSLVAALVKAQFAAKTAALNAKSDALTSQVSAAATLKSTMSNFATALQTLVKGGSLTTQPTSSNSGVLTATALPGSTLSGLSASVTVERLASAQSTSTLASVADRTTVIGSGSITLKFGAVAADPNNPGTNSFTAGARDPVTISVTDASLDGIAAAINAAKSGVTATVVTNSGGAPYLSLKGQTGADQAFSVDSTLDAAKLDLTVNPAQTTPPANPAASQLTNSAVNAKLTIDGIRVERASNTVSDLLTGVKLQLNQVSTIPVTLSSTAPTANLKQAVTDFVDTYNLAAAQVREQTNAQTGVLKSDTAARTLMSSLQGLSTRALSYGVADGAPNTLAAVGVRTNRDGTLSIDAAALDKALADSPGAVEAMFAYSSNGLNGLSAQLDKIVTSATSVIYGLGASVSRYTAAQSALTKQQTDLTDQSTQLTTRLTQQYSTMNAKITAYKATQTFLDNQIKAWNKSGN